MQVYSSPGRVATGDFFKKMAALRAAKNTAAHPAPAPLGGATSLAKKSPYATEAPTKPKTHIFGNEFLASYTKQHREAVQASRYMVVDAETTGLTPHSKPISVGNSAKIGPEHTLTSFRKLYPETTVNVKLRMRVWSVQLEDGSRLAWDLDRLTPEDRKAVVWDTLHKKTVVGHNLAFDFTWAVWLCGRELQPELVLDVMLLARCIKPAAVYAVHRRAAEGVEAAQRAIGKSGNASVSLAALAIGMGLAEPDKSWQHPRNWAVSTLCNGHFEYVMGDIDAPLDVLKSWTGETDLPGIVAGLKAMDGRRGGSYFDIYAKVPLALAKISHTGMPVHKPTLEAVRTYRLGLMPGLIEKVVQTLPTVGEVLDRIKRDSKAAQAFVEHVTDAFGDVEKARNERAMGVFLRKLEAQSSATLAPMKLVLGAYADLNECTLDEGDDGMPIINAKAAKMRGAADLPGWKAWSELQGAKKILALCEEYLGISEYLEASEFQYLHPLLSARTATGRVASQVPNVMNLPRPGRMPAEWAQEIALALKSQQVLTPAEQALLDDTKALNAEIAERWAAIQFRGIVKAPEGHVLISADYGQIELRIAAALALRAIRDAQLVLKGELECRPGKEWLVQALRRGADLGVDLSVAEGAEGFDAFTSRIAVVWRRLTTSTARPMADAFRAGLDPHLLTGITLAARQGLVSLEGQHPIDWLKARTSDEIKGLKKTFANQRQSAKALNFGLLYGMQAEKLYSHGIVDYGLSWSLEDAVDSRQAWFDLFPEIEFLQMWHTLMLMPNKGQAEPLFRKNPYSHALGVEKVRIGASATLRGRPVVATEAREVLNYSDQGSGADMLLEAVTSMSTEAFDCIIDLIHDEILMLVPNELADVVQAELERAMLAAADRVLAPWGIPAEAEGARMAFWKKD